MEINCPADFLELQKTCIERVKFYVKLANEKLSIHMQIPKITFALRGTTAGRAHYYKNLIEFQPTLLRENPDDFITSTAGHEVGHLAAFLKFGGKIKPHGDEWKRCMWTLGLPANRCHNYDVSSVTGNKRNNSNKPPVVIKTDSGIIHYNKGAKIISFD